MAEMKKGENTGNEASKYTVGELASAAATLFKTSPDCVTAALKAAGIQEATKDEARKIVNKFVSAPVPPAPRKKEVR